MDLVVLEKIEPCVLNVFWYIGRLEKKSLNNSNKYDTVTKPLKTVGFSN